MTNGSMIYRIGADEISDQFSEIIDVRSPAEFAEDRVPGAINLPVLDDDERAVVGTIDRREGGFAARKVGAALVSRNIARHLEAHFQNQPGSYRPLVYCWRGGMRSNGLATVLASIGWRTAVLDGGYRAFRRHVRAELERLAGPGSRLRLRIVAGLTGSGKTVLLRRMAARGVPVLDLEALANHRGSLLGREFPHPRQPSQKEFESRLVRALSALPPEATVHAEAESSKIGEIFLPKSLWERLRAAPVVEIDVPADARVAHLLDEYAHLSADPTALKDRLEPLRAAVGTATLAEWGRLIDAGRWTDFVGSLLESHYDPAYLRSRSRIYRSPEVRVVLADLKLDSIDAAIDRMLAGDAEVTALGAPASDAGSRELHSIG